MSPTNVDDPYRSHSPLLRAEDFYLAQYTETRRRSVDTGGLALALRDTSQSYASSGRGWQDSQQHVSIPYAEMLSRLYIQTMPSHCLPDGNSSSHMSPATHMRLVRNTATWAFDALSLSEDDLFNTTCLIFDVLFTVEGAAEEIGIQAHQLGPFLQAMRSVYSHDNTYHNYQHAVDVLQAMYSFLVDAGCIPSISILEEPHSITSPQWKRSDESSGTLRGLLSNIDVFMLFVAALGHDAGHPGLNNGFMKCAGTCLSSLFDHTSTLERMHCTLLLQLMRNFGLGHLIRPDNILLGPGPRNMRSLLVDTVIATDMSLHFRWIKEFNDLIDQCADADTAASTSSDPDELPRRTKLIACQALMKSADISNPVRPHTISEAWSRALMTEWSAQASLERSMALPTSVPSNIPPPSRPSIFSPPEQGAPSPPSHQYRTASSAMLRERSTEWDQTDLSAAKEQVKGQISFINLFTAPLYGALANFAPELAHFHARCVQNRQLWETKMAELMQVEGSIAAAPVARTDSIPSRPATVPIFEAVQRAVPVEQTVSLESGLGPTASERDARSSIDSGPPLFSPGMMTDFSFGGRRASGTTVASSVMSLDSQMEDISANADLSMETASGTKNEAGPSHQASADRPFRRHSRNLSTVSAFSTLSGASSYYTARSQSPDPSEWGDPEPPSANWLSTSTFPLPLKDRHPSGSIKSEWWRSSLIFTPSSPLRGWQQNPFASTAGIVSPRTTLGGFGVLAERNVRFNETTSSMPVSPHSPLSALPTPPLSSSDQAYRSPLGVETMRAAYRASARRQAMLPPGLDYDNAGYASRSGVRGLGGGEMGDYHYRRRSAGNVGPYVRPLAVR